MFLDILLSSLFSHRQNISQNLLLQTLHLTVTLLRRVIRSNPRSLTSFIRRVTLIIETSFFNFSRCDIWREFKLLVCKVKYGAQVTANNVTFYSVASLI